MAADPGMMEIIKVFVDESREGLDVMESGLLRMDTPADSESINTIFRAAHSIKGGAATFGFVEVAHFTHGVETLLDQMRNGTRAVTAEAVQVLLQSCDCLREMIDATDKGLSLNQQRITLLNAELSAILGSPDADADAEPACAPAPGAGDSPGDAGWHIRFEPVPELLKVRNEPIRMFAELQQHGRLAVIADVSALPTLDALDPEQCYLAWDLQVIGKIAEAALAEIFAWVDPACKLTFTACGEPAAPAALPQPDPPAATSEARAEPPDCPARAPPISPKASADSGSIRVATRKVDSIINLVGELVITQSMLSRFADGTGKADIESLRQGLAQLARNTRELHETVMQVRMMPISIVFTRFRRLVHDLSLQLNKKVELVLTGEGTELDKTVLEKISDPMVHLVRNALDHGLETPERRVAAGKGETGTLELAAYHEGGSIIIEVRDDGAGLDRARILAKARARGLVGAEQELGDEQVHNLIFLPGFSTADTISDVSGRGVGMDVVRRNIHDLGGHVQITSTESKGSVIRIRLPLTLAILDGQLVRVGKEVYVISLLAIVETIQVGRDRLNLVAGRAELFRLREDFLPVVKLCDLFSIEPDSRNAEDGLLVVVEADGVRVGLLVDDLLAQQQVVIKSLEANFRPVAGLAGATILGDGTVALILDVSGLIASAAQRDRLMPEASAA